jgi:branched-chain amino acid transport system substrate-binding protein
MKKTIFWFLLFTVCATSAWWLADILMKSKKEYDQFRGAAHARQLYAAHGKEVGIAAAGDWSAQPSLLNGIALAVEGINNSGGFLGRRVKLTPVDDKGSLGGAFEATQQICDQPETLFVIGHSKSRLTQAVVQNYEFYGILMISPLSANLTQSQKNFQLIFSNSTRLDIISRQLLALARKNRWSRMGMIYDASNLDTERAHHFESILISAGIKMPLLLGLYPDQEFPERLMTHQPMDSPVVTPMDGLVVAAGTQDTLAIVRHYRESGFSQPIILGWEPDNNTLTRNKDWFKNVYWPSQIATESAHYQQFSQSYLKRFGTASDINAISGYDAVMMLTFAIKEAQSLEAAKVAQKMKSFTPHSLTGTLGFDANGNAVKEEFNFIQGNGPQ